MSGTRSIADSQAPRTRSAVSNGSRLFVEDMDGRSAHYRRYRDLVSAFISDVGGDPSEAQRQVIRRASALSVWCEAVDARMTSGEDIEIGPYTTACNSLRRLLVDIGMTRTAKDITPSLAEYIEAKAT